METNKLQKLEWEAHQWVQQALPNLEKFNIIFPTDEMTHQCCRRAKQLVGSQHGEHRRNAHVRKDVNPFKSHYLNNRYPEGIAELEWLSASSCHHSTSHCRSLRPEETNHPSAQSTIRASLNGSTRVHFLYLPISSGRRNVLFVGDMYKDQVDISRLEWWLT